MDQAVMNRDVAGNLLDYLPVGVWILDSNFQVAEVNLRIEEFFGIPRVELLGRDKKELVRNRIHTIFENGDEFLRRITATYDQNTYIENFLCHVLPGDGRQDRWLEHFSQPIQQDGAIVGRVEVYFDITDNIEYEEEINWISTQFLKGQEREKARIASNLHNHIGQSVIALKFLLEQLQNSLPPELEGSHSMQIEEIVSRVDAIANDISQVSTDLLPPSLDSFGIEETLNWLAGYYQSMYGLTVDCLVLGVNGKRFPSELEIALFRIFQEGLNNVIKHAATGWAECRLIVSHPRVIAVISDHGKGFEPDNTRHGAGLRIMQRRVAELGGTMSITSGKGQGTTIRVTLPADTLSDGTVPTGDLRKRLLGR